MRTFIAIKPPKPTLDQIQTVLDHACIYPSVPKQNTHLTLIFLGEQSPQNIGEISNIIQDSCKGISSFTCNLSKLIVFKNMYWLTCRPSNSLHNLQKALQDKLVNAKLIGKPNRDFYPHIKLGSSYQTQNFLPMELNINIPINKVILYQSILKHALPAQYIELYSQNLLQ